MNIGGIVGAISSGFGTGAKQDRQTHRRSLRHQTSEREAAQEFSSAQAMAQRDWSSGESQLDRDFTGNQAELARDFNRMEAEVSRSFSAKEAERNRDFQEMMSSTAVQRAAKDMSNAGLNRILALGQPSATTAGAMAQSSPASSPMPSGSRGSGAAASSSGGSSPSGPTNTGPAMARTMLDLFSAKALIDKQDEETKLIKKTGQKVDAETERVKADTNVSQQKGILGDFLKQAIGKEGSTGQQIYQAVKPVVDLDRRLQGQLNKLQNKAKDGITTIRINRGNDAQKHRNRKND